MFSLNILFVHTVTISRYDAVGMEIRLRTGRSRVRIPVEVDVKTPTLILYSLKMAQQKAETCSSRLCATNTFSVRRMLLALISFA